MADSRSAGREYLAARHNLLPQHHLQASDFAAIQVNDANNAAEYVEPATLLALMSRTTLATRNLIVAGQLVRLADLVNPADLTNTQILVPLALAPPDSVQRGDLVDLWATATTSGAEPVLVAQSAQVVGFAAASSGLGSGSRASAQLLVEQSEVSSILSAVASSEQLAIVPVFGRDMKAPG